MQIQFGRGNGHVQHSSEEFVLPITPSTNPRRPRQPPGPKFLGVCAGFWASAPVSGQNHTPPREMKRKAIQSEEGARNRVSRRCVPKRGVPERGINGGSRVVGCRLSVLFDKF